MTAELPAVEPRRRHRRQHRAPACLLLLLALVPPSTSCGQAGQKPANPPAFMPPESLADPRLEMIRMASASWELRSGPQRKVVDQVCLVPDLASFFEAIATWDDSHYFPILIDDVETTFRFIRAFRPARIVRCPRTPAPIAEGKTWERALAAVAASWTPGDDPASVGFAGDAVPTRLGPTPPGVVFSAPTAPMLAGSVALAAGRFQPLVRLETSKRFGDTFTTEEFRLFDRDLTTKVRDRIPNYDRLADGCDFLTLAGDYPYRLGGRMGNDSVDDAVARLPGPGVRWAYAGRLLGDPAASVYRAMCSLFLQPQSATMFNGYEEDKAPWAAYSMRGAATRMSALMPTSHLSGFDLGSINGWYEAFQDGNKSGLVFINSSGGPKDFNIQTTPGGTPDIPRSVPAAVFMIHSFSAADPVDPSTIAGRWLANGAFVYYGSMNEPFLDAFRTPRLVGSLIGEHLPMVVAARETLAEPRGAPWRLVYLGDPLYRLKPKGSTPPRAASWAPTDRWPSYAEGPRPTSPDEGETLRWALKTSLARMQGAPAGTTDDLADVLLEIRRSRLPVGLRPVHDALLADLLLQSRRRGELRRKIAAVPQSEQTSDLRRWYEFIVAAEFQLAITRKDFAKGRAVWLDLIRLDASDEWKNTVTRRLGTIADTPVRQHDWSLALRAAIQNRPRPSEAPYLAVELKRIEEVLKNSRR